MKIGQYCQRQRCKHVELEQFLACFRVARVCQRQLGFLVNMLYRVIMCSYFISCTLAAFRYNSWWKNLHSGTKWRETRWLLHRIRFICLVLSIGGGLSLDAGLPGMLIPACCVHLYMQSKWCLMHNSSYDGFSWEIFEMLVLVFLILNSFSDELRKTVERKRKARQENWREKTWVRTKRRLTRFIGTSPNCAEIVIVWDLFVICRCWLRTQLKAKTLI